ncbi:hypothetical protein C8R44DRAFT_807665 [Mycena epipterygia]|nr:hypothetical protein C8R44DRAFT_807665 [Mycena epipterygia]
MALAGKAAGKDVGMWFEPSAAAEVVRRVDFLSFFVSLLCAGPMCDVFRIAPAASSLSTILVVDQLATSQRSHNSLSDALALDSPIHIYFMPWDETMDTRREYRVFCAPTSEYNPRPNRVTPISQYSWHKPSLLAELPREQIEAEMNHLLEGIERIHGEIIAYSVKNGTKESLDKEGFVFDVYVHTGIGEVQLLELNPFGITSGCGSCLFNWETDAETLYGNKEEIEVRLSI